MIYEYAEDDLKFAEEVRQFVRANLDPGVRKTILSGGVCNLEERRKWQSALLQKGWGAPSWPVEYGGPGWNTIQRHIFDEVLTEEGAPNFPVFGMTMLAPVLMRFGTQKQKAEYLPRILSIENFWCQGFSEPGAGSDLAGLRTRAVLNGDHWVINGQKIWTTLAHEADRIFLLARTSDAPKKQMGISLLLADMDTPGITVRPIITIDGHHEVNEVFFENVKIPAENIIGEEGKGWDYAKYLLGHERTSIARIGQSRREITRLKAAAKNTPLHGATLADHPPFSQRIADIEIRHRILEITTLRLLAAVQSGAKPGAEANLLKIHGSEVQQDLAELWLEVADAHGFAYGQVSDSLLGYHVNWESDYIAGAYFNSRKLSIYGGSNEIQRNIIAKASLGL